jgi:hypothetical protein
MRTACRALGALSLALAIFFLLLTVATWPPGGPLFALPYFFLFAALVFGVVGIVLLIVGQPPVASAETAPEVESG